MAVAAGAAASAAGGAAASAAGGAAASAAGGAAASAAGGTAASAAGGVASSAAGSAAGNVAGEAGGAVGKAGQTVGKAGQQTTQQTQNNLSEMKDKAEDVKDKVDQATDALEKKEDDDDNSEPGSNGSAGGAEGENAEGPKPGEKAGTGKQIGDDGQVEDSSTAKSLKAAGRVVARVYGGEAGGQAADAIAKSKVGDKAIGVVSDVADKTPGVSQATKVLDKAGVADGVNDALDTYEKAKSGDIAGAMESAKKTKKDLKKFKKFQMIIWLISFLIILSPIILCLLIMAVIAQSLSNENNESSDKVYSNMNNYQWSASASGGYTGDPSDTEPEVKVGEAAAVPQSQRMAWLFPNGTPTSASQMSQYLTTIEFDIYTKDGTTAKKTLTVHKKLATAFSAVFKELYDIKFPVDSSCTGAYNWRPMATDSSKQSYHSYGSVVDLNYTYNPLIYGGPNPYAGRDSRAVTSEVVTIWKKYGFKWGGDWTSYQDYMHFTYTGN